jgi:hypothetical protein
MRRFDNALAAVAYVAATLVYFGWELLPHPGNALSQGPNPDLMVWSFAWWAHALGTGTNPMFSHAVYAPYGVNLAWTPTSPGLAFVFIPLTALAGPVVSYNVAFLLAPAVSAWTAFLLCRYLTRSFWASLIGGYLFGFSDAVLHQVAPGDLNLTAVFLLPLVALFTVRYVRRDLDGWGLAWRLGLTLGFQLTISTEFALMAVLALGVGLLLAYAFEGPFRERIRSSVVPIVGGGLLSLVVAAPLTYYLFFHFERTTNVTDIKIWGSDALAAIVPNQLIQIGGDQLSLISHVSSRSAYLGLPTVIIVVLYAIRSWRTGTGRFMLAALLAALVVSLGATLQVYGHTLLTLPWWIWASHVPGLSDALPFRFALLESLVVSVIVALWIASVRGRIFSRPYVLPALAVVAIVPAVWAPHSGFAQRPIPTPAFFASSAYKRCLPPGETLAVLPYWSQWDALVWQARTGFRFRLASGGIQPPAKWGKVLNRFDDDQFIWDLAYLTGYGQPTTGRLLAFAGTHGVDRVLSIAPYSYPRRSQLRALGSLQQVGGAIVSPACGEPPLTTRNLTAFVARWQSDRKRFNPRPTIGWCGSAGMVSMPEGLLPLPSSRLKIASFIEGTGITCDNAPAGFRRDGFAGADKNVPGGLYPYYTR